MMCLKPKRLKLYSNRISLTITTQKCTIITRELDLLIVDSRCGGSQTLPGESQTRRKAKEPKVERYAHEDQVDARSIEDLLAGQLLVTAVYLDEHGSLRVR